jgi:multidrug efflux system membrane fusion protein
MDQLTDPVLRSSDRRTATVERRETSRRGLYWRLAIAAAILIVVFGAFYGFEKFKQSMISQMFSHKPPPTTVAVVKATLEPVPRYLDSIGTASSISQVTVSPQVAGRVVKILFESGAVVKAGDPLVQLDDGAERADLANFQAQAKLAQVNLSRAQSLAKEKYGTQANVDQQYMNLETARAGMARSQVLIDQKLIRAPFGGSLGIRQIDVGRYVSAGTPIITLTDLDRLYIDFTLPENRRASLNVGLPVEVRADAYRDRVFQAEVSTIEPQIDPLTRAIKLRASLPNPDHLLQPGMFVRARVILPPQGDAVTLPETTVDYTTYGESVFVVEESKDAEGKPTYKAVQTFVDVGARYEGKVAITKGVKNGDSVINGGQIRVHNGAAVVPTENDSLNKPAAIPLQ